MDRDDGTFIDFAVGKFAERAARVVADFDDNNQPVLPIEKLETAILKNEQPNDPSFFRDLFCRVE